MTHPISLIYGNLVFGQRADDIWAVYRLAPRSYAELTTAGRRTLLSALAGFAYAAETDFSLLRVARRWSVDQYAIGVEATTDVRHTHRAALKAYLSDQRRRLATRESHTREIYACVRLPHALAAPDVASLTGLASWRRVLAASDTLAINARSIGHLLREEANVRERLLDFLDGEPASAADLEWLIRRAFLRGLEEPNLEEDRFAHGALAVTPANGDPVVLGRPLEASVLRLFDAAVDVQPSALRVRSEHGDSWQAFLCLSALREEVSPPERLAELLCARLEVLDFPVDVAFTAHIVSNVEGFRFLRRRILDAERNDCSDGSSSRLASCMGTAGELEDYLTRGDHPPLLRSSVSLCVSASTEDELYRRVERVRREYGSVKLHQPLADQLCLFVTHLPGQRSPMADADDYLTVEQFAAMAPVATHAVGASVGPCIGTTLTGARHPVLFDVAEGCVTSHAPSTLLAGARGSGKTLCMQLIMYQAFLVGSTICDVDLNGDHALERLPGVAEHIEIIELSPAERFRGLLDPLRIGPSEMREDLACDFLFSLLPHAVPLSWQAEVRMAVHAVVAAGGRTCSEVIAELDAGSQAARDAARALAARAGSGHALLGVARPGYTPPEAGSKQVTSLRIRNLSLAPAGTPRSEMLDEERVGQVLLHLLVLYALGVTSVDIQRHSVLGVDGASVLLSDGAGRALVNHVSRVGRSCNVTPLLATEVPANVEELEGLIGAVFCFGVETEREATKALRLLHLDETAGDLREKLVSFRPGRCLMRDYEGRVSPVHVELDPALLRALDRTGAPNADATRCTGAPVGPGPLRGLGGS